ncbi:MAG: hypothetical protein RM338_06555, partial [Nostoc sp. DedQUE12a]|nr:hypothetical protein [Nostoc sp. DedQUE12a]
LNEVQNQGFTNQIILLAPAWLLSVVETLPSASCLKTSDFVLHAKENYCISFPVNSQHYFQERSLLECPQHRLLD